MISLNFLKRNKEKNEGFVILIAVLVSGIFVVIGASILLISIKELRLSSSGSQSQYAFYAADTGMECALYWDLRHDLFATSSQSDDVLPESGYSCSGTDITSLTSNQINNDLKWDYKSNNTSIFDHPTDAKRGNTIFVIKDLYSGSRSDCAIVYVVKEEKAGRVETQIESRGYNTCDVNNPRRVERALRATY